MKNNNFKKEGTISIMHFNGILFLLVAFLLSSCVSDRKRGDKPKSSSKDSSMVVSNKEIPQTFNRINFYFENSGSMNGYLKGDHFFETMTRLLGEKNNTELNTFFVNSKIHKTDKLLEKIEHGNIQVGNVNSSDHQIIFKTAIENAVNNNLSIVVTDGIYSVKGKKPNIVAVKIEQTFEKSLKENSIETVVLKMSSHYKGTYYTESDCDNVPIDQERPYYILLFGNKETIDNALKNIVIIEDLPGFKEQARFFLTDNLKVDYTILTQGEEKKGSFKKVGKGGKGLVKVIEDAERYDKGNKKYLQFGIAIDYSNISIPDSYLIDTNNYKVDGETGYVIESIKSVSDLSKTSTTYKNVKKVNDREGVNLSHIIVVKAEIKVTGDLEIELENNLPSWIKKTGLENDCEIKGNKEQTFAFDKLMIGISKAYIKVIGNDRYIELKLKIQH